MDGKHFMPLRYRLIKAILSLISFLLLPFLNEIYAETIILKNGEFLKAKVVEYDSDFVKIEKQDGKIIKYNTLDIYKIYSKEISDSEIERIVEDNHLKPELTALSSGSKQSEESFFRIEDAIVATAARKSQKLSEAPSKIIVFSQETIYNRGYRSLTDLFQDIPYTDFNTFNDPGESNTRFGLRGLFSPGQSQILIMENGVIQNDISQGWIRHIGFDLVLVDIERIEIILGPGSALYGTNAYVGLVNIITKKGKTIFGKKDSGTSAEFRAMAGSYGTKAGEGLVAHKFENGFNFQVASRYYTTEGDRGLKRPDPANYFHNNYEPDKVTTTEYGTVANDRLPGNARKKLQDGFNNSVEDYFIRGSFNYKEFTMGFNVWNMVEGLGSYVPGYEYFMNTNGIAYQRHHRGAYLHATHETQITGKLSLMTKIYNRETTIMPDTGFEYTYRYQSIDHVVDNKGKTRLPTWDKSKEYRNQGFLTGYQQQMNYKFSSMNDLVVGLFYEKSQRSDSDQSGISLGKRQSLDSNITERSWDNSPYWTYEQQSNQIIYYSSNTAVYAQDEQKLFNNRYSITGGLRVDQDKSYGKILTPRAGLTGKPIDNLFFKILYGEAFQAPTLPQLRQEFSGNKFLKPQTIKTAEIEISYTFFSRFTLTGGYFISFLKDVIAIAPNPNDGKYIVGSAGQHASYYQNLNPTHIYGNSLEGDFLIVKNFNLFFNYTRLGDRDRKTQYDVVADGNGRITAINPVYDGHEMNNVARDKFNAGINLFLLNKLNINLRMNWTGRRKMPDTNRYYQPYDYNFATQNYDYMNAGYKANGYMAGYTIFNLTLTLKNIFAFAELEPQLTIRNLFNKSYMGVGQVDGNATRPIDSMQPLVQNPAGLNPAYHPQPGREVFFQLTYRY
jgi:outer membrane receptor for ferrienterochelin and colicins